MPFTNLGLHADLIRGLRELGFTRPTPIQSEAIPPAVAGKDLLACAMTGSGKTAAFLLPILHRLLDRPRRTTRALVLTPTRELAAQIFEEFNAFAVHTPLTAAAVFGGVGMGPQEHAFRAGVDVMIATPGRLLDHFTRPYAKLDGLEYLVLDEADRMLDMGFLPDIRRVLRHIPAKRQTLFFSATMPTPIAALASEMLKHPVTINLHRQAAPAVGITQAVYPVSQDLKPALFVDLLKRGILQEALVFTRTKHRANRLAEHLVRAQIAAERIHGNRSQNQRTEALVFTRTKHRANRLADHLVRHKVAAERIHGNRSQPQRTAALAGFKSGKYRVLVATDIAARGIDVEDLSHVVNFDVPAVPEDYIHRVGRTGRAQATGDAFTFVAPEEEGDLRAIEQALRTALPRVTLPDFDYQARPAAKLEVPLAQRIAAIRALKTEERARARAKAERRAQADQRGPAPRPEHQPSSRGPDHPTRSQRRPRRPSRSGR